MDEFRDQVGSIVTGTVQRSDRGVTTVQLGNVEAILPRGEQIPGETYHNGDRIRAVVFEVKPAVIASKSFSVARGHNWCSACLKMRFLRSQKA